MHRPDIQSRLFIRPLTFRQACDFVRELHRHNKPPTGHKFSIGVVDASGTLRGVASAGRPIARAFDDGMTLEINRTCTDGCPNANSILYGAVWRAAKAMGYVRCITYTQKDETGSSLRAVGWVRVKELPARRSWSESTKDPKLKLARDPVGSGGVDRVLWEIQSRSNETAPELTQPKEPSGGTVNDNSPPSDQEWEAMIAELIG